MKVENNPTVSGSQASAPTHQQQQQQPPQQQIIQPPRIIPQQQPQPVIVNWKWTTIDPALFKDISVPCIIRENDPIKEYVCVRIIEKAILSNFESTLSEEAKQFGILNTYFCTPSEIYMLNDINDNHVDKLYGSKPFRIDTDTLVSLNQFLQFYNIVKRTCKTKASKVPQYQNQNNVPRPQTNFQQVNYPVNYAPMNNNQYNIYPNQYDQRLMPRMPNMGQFNRPPQYVSYSINTPNISQLINRPIAPPQPQHQIVQLYPGQRSTPPLLTPVSSATNLITTQTIPVPAQQIVTLRPNFIPQNQRPMMNPQNVPFVRPHIITVNVGNQNQNVTPPLTPMMQNQINTQVVPQVIQAPIQTQIMPQVQMITQNQSNQQPQMVESKETVRTQIGKIQGVFSEIIYLDVDEMLSEKEAEEHVSDDEIDFTSDEFGFVQVNDKILLYIELKDSFYHYDKAFPKCYKYILAPHLTRVTNLINENELKKNLTIVQTDNNERIKKLIKWFNQKKLKNLSLPLILEPQLELVNLLEFQFVFANRPVFFKDLYYLNKPQVTFYDDYKDIFALTGGLFCVPNRANKLSVRPFVEIDGLTLVSFDIHNLLSDRQYSDKIKPDEQVIHLDPTDEKKITKINEFLRLQLFYTSLKLRDDLVPKLETKYYDLKKWLDFYPNNFGIISKFNSNFPRSWLSGYKKLSETLRNNVEAPQTNAELTEPVNNVDTQQSQMNEESVYMSPLSDTESVETISLAVLDQMDKESGFSEEDLKAKPRLRSYSESSAHSKFNTKINFNQKKMIKYAFLFKKRNSCTALDYLDREAKIGKDELINGKPIFIQLTEALMQRKNIDKKLCKTQHVSCSPAISVPIKQEKTDLVESVQCLTPVKQTQKQPVFDISEKDKELLKSLKQKQVSKACQFILDSPARSLSSSQMKRKKSKLTDEEYKKRARLAHEELAEIRKDLKFVVSDDKITKLGKDEHFNFDNRKKSQPENLVVLNQTDLYSTDTPDIDYYIKKFKINTNCQVRVDKLNVDMYMKKVINNKKSNLETKKKTVVRKKKPSVSETIKPVTQSSCSSSSLLSSSSTDAKLNESDEAIIVKKKPIKLLRIESDDEDELPRLDI